MFNPSISACKCEFFKIIIQKRLYRQISDPTKINNSSSKIFFISL